MLKPNKNKKGFSLIEIIISVFVLSVGILGLVAAFPRGSKIQKQVESQAIANNIAQEKMEELLSLMYEEIPLGIIEDSARISSDPLDGFYKFKRTTQISLIDQNMLTSQSDIGLKKITIKVEWGSVFDGPDSNATISTIISKR